MTPAGVPGPVEVLFLGAGDAFHSGGRASTSILLSAGKEALLLDCGPTTPYRLVREGIDPGRIKAVILTHFHGDHTFGLPFLLLELDRRAPGSEPPVLGPAGTDDKLVRILRAAYPELLDSGRCLPRIVDEMQEDGRTRPVTGTTARLQPFAMRHRPESLGYRIEWQGKVLAFTGDTEWNENIPRLAEGADLLVCECTDRLAGAPKHLALETLAARLDRLRARRIVLAHRGRDMASAPPGLPARLALAEDGMRIEV